MSCFSPISIRNSSANFGKRLADRVENTVPCGKCDSCLESKRQDWFLRSHFEYEDCVSNYGRCIFITLTYQNSGLPWIDTSDYTYHEGFKPVKPILECSDVKEYYGPNCMPCFNNSHFDKYIKDVRSDFRRNYGLKGDKYRWRNEYRYKLSETCRFRYFITSEYGTSEFHTHRPHYHVLFYVYPPCEHDFYALRNQLSLPDVMSYRIFLDRVFFPHVVDALRHHWEKCGHGRASYENRLGYDDPYVDRLFALKYVAKYSAKDQYYSQWSDSVLSAFVRDFSPENLSASFPVALFAPFPVGDDYKASFNKYYRFLKSCSPFRHCSQGYGISMVDYLSSLSPRRLADVLANGYHPSGDYAPDGVTARYYRVPQYISDKLLFRFDDFYPEIEDGKPVNRPHKRVFRDEYREALDYLFDLRLKRKQSRLSLLLLSFNLRSSVTKDFVDKYYKGLSVDEVLGLVGDVSSSCQLRDLALYSFVRGVCRSSLYPIEDSPFIYCSVDDRSVLPSLSLSSVKSYFIKSFTDVRHLSYHQSPALRFDGPVAYSYFHDHKVIYSSYHVSAYDFLLDFVHNLTSYTSGLSLASSRERALTKQLIVHNNLYRIHRFKIV